MQSAQRGYTGVSVFLCLFGFGVPAIWFIHFASAVSAWRNQRRLWGSRRIDVGEKEAGFGYNLVANIAVSIVFEHLVRRSEVAVDDIRDRTSHRRWTKDSNASTNSSFFATA